MQKINFIPLIVFEIKFKNPAIGLAKSIFVFNSRTWFFEDVILTESGHYGH